MTEKEKNQTPGKRQQTADVRIFTDSLNSLRLNLESALSKGARYTARFSGGYEGNVDSVFRRVLSVSPHENISELNSVRLMFSGFDTLPDSKKNAVLTGASERILRILSQFESGFPETSVAEPNQPGLYSPVDMVEGAGSFISSFFAGKNIRTVFDALFYFPYRYEDRRNIQGVSSAVPNSWQTVCGRVDFAGKTRPGPGAQFRVVLRDGGSSLELVWFHFDERYMKSKYQRGKLVLVSGDVQFDGRRRCLQILHPKPDRVEILDKADEVEGSVHINRIAPVYSIGRRVAQRRLRSVMKNVSDLSGLLGGIVPEDCAPAKISLPEAVKQMHFPEQVRHSPDFSRAAWRAGRTDRTLPAPKAVAFFEFLVLRLAIEMSKNERCGSGGIKFKPPGAMSGRFISGLPFVLTEAQKDAFSRISSLMESPNPMNALLQGDVGSGKTVIALQAIIKAVDSGYQAAFMVPTQILAEQHARFISIHTRGLGIKTALLKGGDSSAGIETISSGEARIVVGTHALIYDRVKFKRLGLVVVDEQHKFGVAQRRKLTGKGAAADMLVMTATPIPRSLAMTVYGDLEVVTVKGMPGGRKKVDTFVLGNSPTERRKMTDAMKKEIDAGMQCYVVCPFIETDPEDTETDSPGARTAGVFETASGLRQDLPGAAVSVLHGKMPPEEKDRVMEDFQRGKTDVLVSTTVVEVGIDVPNATLVVVENADRFGLSQIHQIRGRVGRGAHNSSCILLKSPEASDEGAERLEVVRKSSDGFAIAEADLAMRGPGEFLGTKQSGAANFRFADLVMDSEVLAEARESAKKILENDPDLSSRPKLQKLVREAMKDFTVCE